MEIYYIGGSPCSGKSTVAEALAERYGLHYFKVDDHLDRYLKLGAEDRKPCCLNVASMTPEQIWMREPQVQCEEELRLYEEISGYILADLKQIDAPQGIMTEGAAWLPRLARQLMLPDSRYMAMTPTKEFQVFHYSKREWVPYVLAQCSDKEKAFENWMERDALFAQAVRQQCAETGYASLVNGGAEPVDVLIAKACEHFGLA